MSITIDYIAMPPKSQEVSQIQTAEQTRLNQEQQQIAAQFQHEVKQNSETAIRRRDVDNEELRNEEKNKGKKKKKQSSRTSGSGKEKEEEKKAVNPIEGSLFDMKI